jgi:protein involved in polysaccharide export with SLBB domain
MTVGDLVRAAGGLNQEAFTLTGELTRFEMDEQGRGIRTLEVGLDGNASANKTAAVELQPFDSLQVKSIPEWYDDATIAVSGEIRFPGEYSIKRGETLTQLLQRAGGLTNLAYPEGAIFSRELLREREREQIEQLLKELRAEIAGIPGSASRDALAAGQSAVQELEQTEPLGRLVIDLPAYRDGRADDVALRDGDKLFVPRVPQEVTVIGEVPQSTSHLFIAGLDRDDYVDRSGGTTTNADKKRIYIVRANGAVIASSGSRWFGSRTMQRIEPGDVIVVPLDLNRLQPLEIWTAVAQVMQSFAITIAAAKSIGVF